MPQGILGLVKTQALIFMEDYLSVANQEADPSKGGLGQKLTKIVL
jgi:hypothetical protein